MKKGFISMSVIYTFLILFLLVATGLVSSYLTNDNMEEVLVNDTKEVIYANK